MGFKCGIVGLPNVGKSTLFNALTQAGIEAQNYPFCTIEPNIGMVPVPDPRLDQLANIVNPQQVIPTTIQFVDIAGLVKGASKGEGLGNQFLANIRETDAIAHVVRCFENPDVIHVDGTVNPINDIETIHTELALADLEAIEKALKKKADGPLKTCLNKAREHLETGAPVRTLDLVPEEHDLLKPFCLLTQKPTLYVANIDESGMDNNPLLTQVKTYARQEGSGCVAICAAIEAEILELDPEDKAEFLSDMGMTEPGLNRVIRAGYDLLNLQTYFTAGVKEVRAWTVHRGATAPEAAGVIHTDFQKGFIRAEVVSFNDFINYKGEQGAKEAGKLRSEGKDYITRDGDVIHFRFNV